MMNYKQLGRTGLKISPLCLGTLNFGPYTNEKNSYKIMNKALNSGINFGKGTNTEDIKALTQKVGEILGDGSVDPESIKRVTYALGRTEYTVWNSTEEVAAAMIAEMASREQAYALGELKMGFFSPKSLFVLMKLFFN